VKHVDWFGVAFDLLLPLVLIPVWFLLTYAVERSISTGPLSSFLRSFNWLGAIFLLGCVYTMSVTSLLGLPPRTLWVSVPIWTLAFGAVAYFRYSRKRKLE
jgi:hypothetical protein